MLWDALGEIEDKSRRKGRHAIFHGPRCLARYDDKGVHEKTATMAA